VEFDDGVLARLEITRLEIKIRKWMVTFLKELFVQMENF